MFCGNCGKPIPEGQTTCQFCNPPAQQPAEPDFTLAVPAEGSRPSKFSKKTLMIVVAIVVAAAVLLAAFNFAGIIRFFKRSFAEPAVYLQDVEKAHVADFAEDLATGYDKALETYSPKGSSTSGNLTLKVNEQLLSLLSNVLGRSDLSMELDWIKSISLSPEVSLYENTMRYNIGLALNNIHLATISVVMDMDNGQMLVGVPELSDRYLSMEADADTIDTLATGLQAIRALSAEMLEVFPSGQQLEDLINRYFAIVAEGLEDVEKSTETKEVDGLKQSLLVMTVKLSQKDLLKIASNLLQEAKDDDTLKQIIEAYSAYMDETAANGSQYPIRYEDFSEALDEGIAELDAMIDEAESGRFLTIETYLDSKDNVAGRSVTVSMDGEKIKAHYITVTQGSKYAFEAEMDTLEITGEGKIKGGKRTGSYVLTVDGEEYGTLEIENYYRDKDGIISGTFRLIPEEGLYDMLDLDADMLSMLGQPALSLSTDGSSATVSISINDKEMVSLSLSAESALPSPIAIPDSVSADDSAAASQWLSGLDMESLLAKLQKAGVPEEYTQLIEQLLPTVTNTIR